jgi:hypothetical protein
MKAARILILAVLLGTTAAMPAFAQERSAGQPPDEELVSDQASPGRAPSAARRDEVRKKIEAIRIWRLTEELKLDTNTSARMASVISSMNEQRRDLRRNQREQLRALRVTLQSSAPDTAKLKTMIDRLEKENAEMMELRSREFSMMKDFLTIEQQARYILFQVDFMHEMRTMIHRARSDRPFRNRGQGNSGPEMEGGYPGSPDAPAESR